MKKSIIVLLTLLLPLSSHASNPGSLVCGSVELDLRRASNEDMRSLTQDMGSSVIMHEVTVGDVPVVKDFMNGKLTITQVYRYNRWLTLDSSYQDKPEQEKQLLHLVLREVGGSQAVADFERCNNRESSSVVPISKMDDV